MMLRFVQGTPNTAVRLLASGGARLSGLSREVGSIRTFISNNIYKLEQDAMNSASDAAYKSAVFLRELNRLSPSEVIRRVEAGQFPMNPEVMTEYEKARSLLHGGVPIRPLQSPGGLTSPYYSSSPSLSSVSSFSSAPSASLSSNSSSLGWGQHAKDTAYNSTPPPSSSSSSSSSASSYGGFFADFRSDKAAGGDPRFPLGSKENPFHIHKPDGGSPALAWSFLRTALVFGLVAFFLIKYQQSLLSGSFKATAPVTDTHVLFDDVKGCDESKAELVEIVQYLRNPRQYTSLGAKLPKGVLLTGPPGTGKTLLAKAVAGEADVPFFYTSASEFEEMFVGVGAKRVRDLFAAAKQSAPSIIFIDEIDAIGGKRDLQDKSAMRMTLNQLLSELDGFQSTAPVVVIAATNTPDILDKALTRPGRFDKTVAVPLPDIEGRKQILDHYLSKVIVDPKVDSRIIARGTPGFAGADLANLINVAAIKAAAERATAVSTVHLEQAKDTILMGVERKTLVQSEYHRSMTAYHEGGHALVGVYTAGAMPIYKATVMARGLALGMVQQLPTDDMLSISKQQAVARIDVAMGGRAAEELQFGPDQVTAGCASDIQQATAIARNMVMQWGMNDIHGLKYVSAQEYRDLSPDAKNLIDEQVDKILKDAYDRAKHVLTTRHDELHRLAKALLEYETLTGDEIQKAIRGERIDRTVTPVTGLNAEKDRKAKQDGIIIAPHPEPLLPVKADRAGADKA